MCAYDCVTCRSGLCVLMIVLHVGVGCVCL